MDLSDTALLDRLRKGDDEAFSALFLRHYQVIFRFSIKLTGNREEAEDLAQEVFVRLHSHPPNGDRQHNLPAWLYRVALNQAYNANRSRRREAERQERSYRLIAPSDQVGVDPADTVLRREQCADVRQILRSLPRRQYQCLILRHEGFSYAEIASALGVAPGSVGTLLARAEAEFARRYKAYKRGED